MTSVRQIEVDLGGLEDDVLDSLGYREYQVLIGNTPVVPKPEVIMQSPQSFSDSQIRQFIDKLGGKGNPVSYFQVTISRLFPEATVRSMAYWNISRDGYSAECLPVSITVTDSRYVVILGVLKQAGN